MNDKKNILTVFIVTYNRSNYLKLAIQSILDQTLNNFDIVILDNASTDDTEAVVKNFLSDRIVYKKANQNIPGFENMNRAFNLADTKYLTIFHDDDIMLPSMLETQINYLELHNDVSLIACCAQFIDEKGTFIERIGTLNLSDNITYQKFDYWRVYLHGMYLPMPTVMYRRAFIEQNKLRFNGDVGPNFDQFFWLQVNLLDTKMVLLKEKLCLYRKHALQLSDWGLFAILLNRVTYKIAQQYHIDEVVKDLEDHKVYHVNYLIVQQKTHRALFKQLIEEGFFNSLRSKHKFKMYVGFYAPYLINAMALLKHKIFKIKN